MLPAPSTLEQPLFTTDSLRNCEGNPGQVSSPALATFLWGVFLVVTFETDGVKTFSPLVVADNVHQPTQASEGERIIPQPLSPLTASYQDSNADMTLVPPSSSPSAENVTNDSDCKVTTLVRFQISQFLAV
jgi:hypothetical protein